MVTARGENEINKGKKKAEDEGMKFNLGDKLVMKSGVNVRGLNDPRVRRARAERQRVEMKEKKN